MCKDCNPNHIQIDYILRYYAQIATQITYRLTIVEVINVYVLSDNMLCQVNFTYSELVEGESVHFTCRMDYWGLWAPYITFDDNRASTQYNTINETTDTVAVYSVVFTVTPEDNGRILQAHLRFPIPPDGAIPTSDNKDIYAENAPSFTSGKSFDPLTVYCKYFMMQLVSVIWVFTGILYKVTRVS